MNPPKPLKVDDLTRILYIDICTFSEKEAQERIKNALTSYASQQVKIVSKPLEKALEQAWNNAATALQSAVPYEAKLNLMQGIKDILREALTAHRLKFQEKGKPDEAKD